MLCARIFFVNSQEGYVFFNICCFTDFDCYSSGDEACAGCGAEFASSQDWDIHQTWYPSLPLKNNCISIYIIVNPVKPRYMAGASLRF